MVASREDTNGVSLHAPLLGDYGEENENARPNRARYEVVVAVGDEPQDGFERSVSGRTERENAEGGGEQPEVNYDTPALANQSGNTFQQIHDQNRIRFRDRSRRGLPMTRSERRGHSVRNPIHKKSFVARAAYSAKTDTLNFLYYVMIGLYMWPKWSWDAMKANTNLTVLSIKQGACAGLASVLCVLHFPQPYTQLSSIALWAVITTDLLYESNIGLSISKGFNRVLGTLAAGFLGFGLNQLGPELGPVYPYYVVFCVTVGGAVFKFLKGTPPLKDRWDYAFTVATMAFHIFIITAYLDPERWTLPMLRFSMILLGFSIATLVNIAFRPVYAGDSLHKLVAKNFETAASVFERCVQEYIKVTMLDHVPDILSGRSEDDKIHQSYHEIVMSDSDIDKLLGAVLWEPSHGKFFKDYPWHMYDDITDYLRYTLYDVIALDSCLRANIQAPKQLRDLFAPEMATIATECATVLRTLGNSMKNMKKFPSEDIMKRAEEAAIALQYKVYLNTNMLLGNTNSESPIYPRSISSEVSRSFTTNGQESENWKESNYTGDDNITSQVPGGELFTNESSRTVSPAINTAPSEGNQNSRGNSEQKDTSMVGSPGLSGSPGWSGSPQGGILLGRSGPVKKLDTLTEGVQSVDVSVPNSGTPGSTLEQPSETQAGMTTPRKRTLAWQATFSHRKYSLGSHWEGTLERISALSLVKFASLLIEVVSKMRYVVDCVEDLAEQADRKSVV